MDAEPRSDSLLSEASLIGALLSDASLIDALGGEVELSMMSQLLRR